MAFATGAWVEVKDELALEEALLLCKGSYQRDVVLGFQSLSGSTLRGAAKNWSRKYAVSRRELMDRLTRRGLAREEVRDHGRRVLVIGGVS